MNTPLRWVFVTRKTVARIERNRRILLRLPGAKQSKGDREGQKRRTRGWRDV
jgi:hypothetical protein